MRQNQSYPAEVLGLLLRLLSFLRLATAVGTLLLSLVMGMGLFVVVAALAAEEEQNLLSVASHAASVPRSQIAVKGTTMLLKHQRQPSEGVHG